MPRETKPKTVTDYFRSGVELDAAVRRAVRQAVGVAARKPAKSAKVRSPRPRATR